MYRQISILLALSVGAGVGQAFAQAQIKKGETIEVKSVELFPQRGPSASKLFLIGTNGDPALLPSGQYEARSGAMIIVLDGFVSGVVTDRGKRFEVESMEVERGRVSLIGTNGIVGLPNGKFESPEGVSIIIQNGTITQVAKR